MNMVWFQHLWLRLFLQMFVWCIEPDAYSSFFLQYLTLVMRRPDLCTIAKFRPPPSAGAHTIIIIAILMSAEAHLTPTKAADTSLVSSPDSLWPLRSLCAHCKKNPGQDTCSMCHTELYCSPECKDKAWPAHSLQLCSPNTENKSLSQRAPGDKSPRQRTPAPPQPRFARPSPSRKDKDSPSSPSQNNLSLFPSTPFPTSSTSPASNALAVQKASSTSQRMDSTSPLPSLPTTSQGDGKRSSNSSFVLALSSPIPFTLSIDAVDDENSRNDKSKLTEVTSPADEDEKWFERQKSQSPQQGRLASRAEVSQISHVLDTHSSDQLKFLRQQSCVGLDLQDGKTDYETLETLNALDDVLSWLPGLEEALSLPETVSKEQRIAALQKALDSAMEMGATKASHRSFGEAQSLLRQLAPNQSLRPAPPSYPRGSPAKVRQLEKVKLEWSQLPPQKLEERANTAAKVQMEILQTEASYVRALNLLKDKYVVPLQQSAAALGIKPEQEKILCSNLISLQSVHEALMKDFTEPSKAATVLSKYSNFFKMYTEYLNGYEPLLDLLAKLTTKSDRAAKFLAGVRETLSQEPGGLNLMSYLIMPVQRVPRYVLLLKELARVTDPRREAEFSPIEEALESISKVASSINEGKRKFEITSRVLDVQQRVQGANLHLLAPHRRIIREGALRVEVQKEATSSANPARNVSFNKTRASMSSRPSGLMMSSSSRVFGGGGKPHVVFLFNDMVVWCTPKLKLVDRWNELWNVKMTEAEDLMYDDLPFAFGLTYRDSKLIFQAQDELDYKQWVSDLHTVLKTQENLHSRKRERETEKRVKVTLIICGARNLPIGDTLTRSSDPYVSFEMSTGHDDNINDHLTCKTAVVKQCLNPTWREKFELPFDHFPSQLELNVYDEDFLKADDFLGKCTLDLSTFPMGGELQEVSLELSEGLSGNTASKKKLNGAVPTLEVSVKVEPAKGWTPSIAEWALSEKLQ
eukprot:g71387.t1